MLQGTTPTFTLTFPSSLDLSEADHVVVTIRQGSAVVNKFDDDLSIDANVIEVTLTQEESLRFQFDAPAVMMVNWTYSDGSRGGSKKKEITIEENLYPEVIEDAD